MPASTILSFIRGENGSRPKILSEQTKFTENLKERWNNELANAKNKSLASLSRSGQNSNLNDSVMARLLSQAKSSFVVPHKGKILKGKITKLTSSEILVDINAKTEASVLEKDRTILKSILSALKVGDEVSVSVLNPESESGNPVVSLRRFMDDIVWEKLREAQKNQSPINGIVRESPKAGLIIDTELGISAFAPNSQITNLDEAVLGKKLQFFVLDLDKTAKKVILSQRKVITKEQFKEEIKELKIGQKIDAKVSSVTNFGLFVNLQEKQLDGLVHISEISWEKIEPARLQEEFTQGQNIEVFILDFDEEAKRVNLSIKRLTKDPYEEVLDRLKIDQKVSGTVAKITATGITVTLDGDEMLSKIDSVVKKEKIPPTVSFKVGDLINATVESIDREKHRIILIPVLQAKPIGYR